MAKTGMRIKKPTGAKRQALVKARGSRTVKSLVKARGSLGRGGKAASTAQKKIERAAALKAAEDNDGLTLPSEGKRAAIMRMLMQKPDMSKVKRTLAALARTCCTFAAAKGGSEEFSESYDAVRAGSGGHTERSRRLNQAKKTMDEYPTCFTAGDIALIALLKKPNSHGPTQLLGALQKNAASMVRKLHASGASNKEIMKELYKQLGGDKAARKLTGEMKKMFDAMKKGKPVRSTGCCCCCCCSAAAAPAPAPAPALLLLLLVIAAAAPARDRGR